jgi:hypothetical protein
MRASPRLVPIAILLSLPPLSAGSDELLGGSGCSCPQTCGITEDPPAYGGSTCVDIQATWTRLLDGCAQNDCSSCRLCLGRLRVVMTASAECVNSEGGYVKTSWSTQTTEQAPPHTTTTTGSGTGALGVQGDGSYSSTDIRDMQAGCGLDASYSAGATTGLGNTESVTATYSCDSCSAQ